MKKRNLITCAVFMLLLFAFTAVAAAVEDVKTLSIDQAVERAFHYNNNLKKIKDDIDTKERYRDDAAQLLRYTPVDRSFEPGETNLFRYYYGADFEYRKAKKELENEKKKLVIDVYKAYYDVLAKQLDVREKEAALNKADIELKQVSAKFNVGMANNLDLLEAKTKVEGAKADLKKSQQELDSAYAELNILVGYNVDERPKLTDSTHYTKVDVSNIDSLIGLALSNSFEIWTAEEAAELAKTTKLFAKYYDEGEREQRAAEMTVDDTKDALRKTVRNLCLGIEAMDKGHQQIMNAIEQASEAVRIAEASYKVGTITLDKVLEAKIALARLQAQKTELEANYQVAVMTLDRLTDSSLLQSALDDNEAKSNSKKDKKAEPAAKTGPKPKEKLKILFTVGKKQYQCNDQSIDIDAAPYVKDNRTYVPVRYLAYALGIADDNISYNGRKVSLKKDDTELELTIGKPQITVNGEVKEIDVMPEIHSGRTMLPARFVAESFGCSVMWNGSNSTMEITNVS